MSRIIPNEQSFIGFVTKANDIVDISSPTAAEMTSSVDLTAFVVSLTASTQGNQLPTPAFNTLFETSISGTVQSSFTVDCYRDDATDTAWDTLTRGSDGFFVIERYNANGKPTTGDVVEIWPVRITSRSMQAMSSNQVQMFQVTCAVTLEPDEDSTVVA